MKETFAFALSLLKIKQTNKQLNVQLKMCHSLSCADLDFDCQLFIGSQRVLIGQRQEADLVQSVRGIGDQFPEEDLWHTSDVSMSFKWVVTLSDRDWSFSFTLGSFEVLKWRIKNLM